MGWFVALVLGVIVVVQNFGRLLSAGMYIAGLFGYKPPAPPAA